MPLKCADGVSRRARGELERRFGVWGVATHTLFE